jgi:DNA polymerase I
MFDTFVEMVFVDAEFEALPGERQVPVCLVARELRSGRRFRLWQDELLRLKAPPYATGRNVLFCSYYVSAELGCYRNLEWPTPERIR